MYRPAPKHPLASFRFWFLVLSCVAATTAWRLGWLPSTTAPQAVKTEEVVLPEAPAAEKAKAADATKVDPRAAALEAALAASQTEPPATEQPAGRPTEATDLWAGAATSPVENNEASQVTHAVATTESANPFGPANLEFVPADTFARPEAPAATSDTQRFAANPGMITQVAGSDGSEPTEPTVTAAAVLSGDAQFDFPQPQPVPQVDWAGIDRMINDGQDVEAHRLLSTLYWEQPDLREKARERIEQTAMRIYFQPQPHYIDPYVVLPGDLLQNVARQYNVSWQYLAKLNRTDPNRIRAGQKLKVIQGPFGAVIDLRRFELTVHANGYFVAHFPIGIGKDGSTPVGEFRVQDKLENPTYYGPDGVIAADDPQNPLGEFWLSLGDSYGIHGTIDEGSIGRAESRGCLRLKRQDIADLYDLLTVGSPVVIRR
ncbi:MAG: L,D-transpeptidase family protein [Planctomycetaceae bacterium]